MDHELSVYCADIGSVAAGNFAWFGDRLGRSAVSGTSMPDLAAAVAVELCEDRRVALGFECPLFVPIASDPKRLTAGRETNGDRPWSAGAGCGALATGLVQVVWLLREVRRLAGPDHRAYLDWNAFIGSDTGLFIWEAFVSGQAKGTTHVADAQTAVMTFVRATHLGLSAFVTSTGEVYSLIGAALVRSGWSSDATLLGKPCVVLRATERAV